jgi:cell division control protein 24
MATVAGRKKSIISTTGLQIDTNANNTLLNKAASQSTSLYQQCSALRSRLMRIRGIAQYFENTDSRQSTDPVNQLWDLFSSGISLCYIFDQLPEQYIGGQRLNNSSFNQEKYEANPDKEKKHAIALFAMRIRSEKVMKAIPGLEEFTISDLWNRNSTNGLVKVSNISPCHLAALLIISEGRQHRHRHRRPSTARFIRRISSISTFCNGQWFN